MNTSDTIMSLESLTAYKHLGSDPSGRSAYFVQDISEFLSAQLHNSRSAVTQLAHNTTSAQSAQLTMLRKRKGNWGYNDTEYNDSKSIIQLRNKFIGNRIRRYNYENSLTISVTNDY